MVTCEVCGKKKITSLVGMVKIWKTNDKGEVLGGKPLFVCKKCLKNVPLPYKIAEKISVSKTMNKLAVTAYSENEKRKMAIMAKAREDAIDYNNKKKANQEAKAKSDAKDAN